MPVDELGFRFLKAAHLDAGSKSFSPQTFINAWVVEAHKKQAGPNAPMQLTSLEALPHQKQLARALGEAWSWLVAEGMVAIDPVTIHGAGGPGLIPYFVTRWGARVLDEGSRGLDLNRARRRLGVELHQDLAAKLRPLIQVGAFEQAAFVALREIEQRVKAMAENPKDKSGQNDLRGDALMTFAFNPKSGPLTDSSADSGERQGVMNLFKGAFAAFRNPLGHRPIEFDDPTEAAEVVLFADLLMRQLDHIESRISSVPAT